MPSICRSIALDISVLTQSIGTRNNSITMVMLPMIHDSVQIMYHTLSPTSTIVEVSIAHGTHGKERRVML